MLLLAQAVASRPDLIDGIGVKVLSWVNSLRGKPADTGVDTWREHLQQLESVSLSRRDLTVAFSWSLFNWIADVACLAFAAYAAGGKPSLAGLTVAYAAARAVGSIPLMPGGLLVVEAVLVPGLVSSGMTLASAISAMLIYRLVSWIFIAAIGWVVFFFMFRTEKDVDPDAALDETADPPETRRRSRSQAPTRLLGRCMPTRSAPSRSSGRARAHHRFVLVVDGEFAGSRRSRRRPQPTAGPARCTVAVTPVLASVVAAPVPVPATDGKIHLAYELQLTNVLAQDVTLTSVAVLAGDQTLLTLAGDQVGYWTRIIGTPTPTTKLGPGQTGIVWLDVALDKSAAVPADLIHTSASRSRNRRRR